MSNMLRPGQEDTVFDASLNPTFPDFKVSALNRGAGVQYARREQEAEMASSPDEKPIPRWVAMSFSAFALAVVGGGFAWLHTDLSDVRADVKEVAARVDASKDALTNSINQVSQQVGIIGQKLDDFRSEQQSGSKKR